MHVSILHLHPSIARSTNLRKKIINQLEKRSVKRELFETETVLKALLQCFE